MDMVAKILSGGQTGVDRAALEVALELKIPCGGWCPHARRAEDGAIPAAYRLEETPTSNYRQRTSGGACCAWAAGCFTRTRWC
jgi:hypothetical protein